MNLLDLIGSELEKMHLNDFEKVRYIYLRTCQLFYFDARYYYVEQFDKKLYKQIVNKKVDITKVDDFSVICHSYSKYILLRLINELTTANVSLQSGSHSFVEYIDDSGSVWNLDATLGDLSRIKVGLKSTGFVCLESWNFNYQDILDEIDELIGYKYKEKKDYIQFLDLSSFDDLINSINILINDSKLDNFTDVLFFVKWLLNGCFCMFSDCTGMDNNYNFYNFIYDESNNDLYCLSKGTDKYGIKEISFDAGLQLSKKLHMNSRNFFNNSR